MQTLWNRDDYQELQVKNRLKKVIVCTIIIVNLYFFISHFKNKYILNKSRYKFYTAIFYTGLNPAKKGFPMDLSPKFRIDRSNAAYVDVIHTDWSEGEKPIGHADFYPNAGIQPQPGCPSADTGIFINMSCNHVKFNNVLYTHLNLIFLSGECNNQRALDLYVESINGNRFQSYRCVSGIDDLKTKTCNGPPAPMGFPLSVG